MLDTTRPHCHPARAWLDNATPGDIVLFTEPSLYGEPEQPAEATPYLVSDMHSIKDHVFLVLAKGGPVGSAGPRPFEIRVSSKAAWQDAGFCSPASFNLHHRLIVVDDHEGYCLQESGSAIVGTLVPLGHSHLQAFRTPERIAENRQSCQWAIQHLVSAPSRLPDARRQMIVPVPYSLPGISPSIAEI